MHDRRTLVAGVGDIFQGDDAFGIVVAARMMQQDRRENVDVTDFGIRSYDLAFAILRDYDAVILVDACARGGEPGTVYLIDPENDGIEAGRIFASGHSMNPEAALGLLEVFGGYDGRLYIVGCEPETIEPIGGEIGLSEAVEAAVDEAISMVDELILRFQSETELVFEH